MYERNAIIIERFFNNLFGYDIKNNIKANYEYYCELIDVSERYKTVTEEEEEIIIEYDIIANKIRDIQKKQEILNKKNTQLQQERNEVFENIEEDANLIQKKLDKVNNAINNLDEEIKENASNFTNVVAEFNEKSIVRDKCGKKRRVIEKEYNNKLNDTLENYKNIDINLAKRAKQFIELDSTESENELKNKIQKNGEKEKVPFNKEVIEQAINVSIDTQKRETDILANIYEKTNKLFSEIKSNSIKIEKHKKTIVDSKCKLSFINAIKEYIIQFLDNERLAAVNGEEEYSKLMEEACKNINEDLVQINNLYALLIKEITRKATKKSYLDLYNIEYLKDLERNAEEFENQVKKLKLPVAVINPNHWRIDGMKRIYEVFNKSVTEEYGRDLKEFINIDNEEDDSDEDESSDEEIKIEENNEIENIDINNYEDDNNAEFEQEDNEKEDEDNIKSDIDKKIDVILGITENDEKNSKTNDKNIDNKDDIDEYDEDEWDEDVDIFDEDEDFEDEESTTDKAVDDLFENDFDDSNEDTLEDLDIDDFEDDEDIEIFETDNNEDQEKEIIINNKNDNEVFDDFDEEADYDIWGNNITKKEKKPHHRQQNNEKKQNDDWENEFVNFDNKGKNKKSTFFSKFKK
ncbi:MAG TPA: hypothetical protein DEP51_06915 [Clostridiales bacterium]|nr:hypothetical protein [Clostridiales bacterium]